MGGTVAVAAREQRGGGLPARAAAPAPATFVTVTGRGMDTYWRAESPSAVLGARMIAVPDRVASRALTQPNRDTPFPWRLHATMPDGERVTISTKKHWRQLARERTSYLDLSAEFPACEGTVVWTRPDMPRAALALAMQADGARCLGETDDNYFADPSQNLALRQQRFSESDQLVHAKGMCVMDGLVFATAALRDLYVRELRARMGRRNVPEAFVCRNHIPRSSWPDRVERDGALRVGFMGSSSHVWDVNLAYPAFAAAKAAGCETVMIGYSPADPDPDLPDVLEDGTTWRSEKSVEHKRIWSRVVDRHIRWIEPTEYHRAALPLDIGIAPLRHDGFTAGKSDVKAIEYTISGAAVVCAALPVYNSAGWKHEVNCLMAGSPREYADAVTRLVRDPKLRFELVTAAQEYVASERNEDVMRMEWMAALNG